MRNLFVLLCFFSLQAYEFTDDPIDVVIPCHSKDMMILEKCIAGIKRQGQNIRRVIVISNIKLTENAEHFSESLFPFTKEMVVKRVLMGKNASKNTWEKMSGRGGWIYQQLLKFYAPYIIPNISSNILILDADTVFLNPVSFQDPVTNAALFNVGTENNKQYFDHANRLIPGFRKVFEEHSGICHYMLFQKSVIDHLFSVVQKENNAPFWQAFCKKINPEDFSGCSEYEIYFNFAFRNSKEFKIRKLDWKNVERLQLDIDAKNYHYVSCHSWM